MPAKKKATRGTAGARKKSARQALPGGAPLKAAPRGKSRKKAAPRSKTAAKKKAPKAKPPCKYGPRDSEGRCPKKPASSRRQTTANRTRVTARTTSSATTQAIDVVTNPRASAEQKTAAVAKVAETAATDALKSGAKKVIRSSRLQKAKGAAVSIAKRVGAGGVGVLGPFASAASIVLTKYPTEAKLKALGAARKKADAAVALVEKTLKARGQSLTRKQRNLLLKQHIDFFIANPGV